VLLALGLVAFAGTSSVAVRTASAQDAAPTADELKQAKEAYAAGKKLFEAKKFAEAVEKFKDSYRLSHNPLLLFNIALTFSELGTKDMALFYYKKFMSDAPADAAQRADAEKAIKELEAEAVVVEPPDDGGKGTDDGGKGTDDGGKGTDDGGKGVDDGGKGTDDGGARPPPREYTIEDFEHAVVDEAPPGKPLDLIVSPDDAPWIVTLYYRPQNEEKFVALPMRSHHKTLVARIPSKVMSGNAVQYYIEVKDEAGTLLTRVGKSTSPNVVYIDSAARPQYYPDLEDAGGTKAPDGDQGGGGSVNVVGDNDNPPGFGEEVRPGGGFDPNAKGPVAEGPGFTDVGSGKFKYAKWGATGAGLGMLTMSVTFGLMASSYAASLEAEAVVSNDETCTEGPPCRPFDEYRKGIEDTGERYELISRITLAVGVAATGVAAWFWYKELKANKRHERVGAAKATTTDSGLSSLVTAPLVGDDLFGAAAALRF